MFINFKAIEIALLLRNVESTMSLLNCLFEPLVDNILTERYATQLNKWLKPGSKYKEAAFGNLLLEEAKILGSTRRDLQHNLRIHYGFCNLYLTTSFSPLHGNAGNAFTNGAMQSPLNFFNLHDYRSGLDCHICVFQFLVLHCYI